MNAKQTDGGVGFELDCTVEGSLEPSATLLEHARRSWNDLRQHYASATGGETRERAWPIRIRRAVGLASSQSARSTPGLVMLRQNREGVVDDDVILALRHELAHQFLWAACPAGSSDRLFHEAWAMSTSGELLRWLDGSYIALPEAQALLHGATDLDQRDARRALARVLTDQVQAGKGLAPALQRRLRTCATGARWPSVMTAAELAGETNAGDAWVVVNRHSGDVLHCVGECRLPIPVGSTLKPFVVAGAPGAPPLLRPDKEKPQWQCADKMPAQMNAHDALLLSCNGYFMDWGSAEPTLSRFGTWGPVLERLGLNRLPTDMSEAIGLRRALRITPVALAHAYRLLAEANPRLIHVLRDNVACGTLSGLAQAEPLRGVVIKTGTVRDGQSQAEAGWIVAVDENLVAVMAQQGRAPRTFVGEMVEAWKRAHELPAQQAAEVQVLGLVDEEDVEASCESGGWLLTRAGPRDLVGWKRLKKMVAEGVVICAGAPWRIRFPGIDPLGRPYAGIFRWSPPPHNTQDANESIKVQRARRGSGFVFRTSLASYAAGVVAAEDATVTGSARSALIRVVAHNVQQNRHGKRPICDTTHCQAFRGTAAPGVDDLRALARPLKEREWLPFSQGGEETWQETRTLHHVVAALGMQQRWMPDEFVFKDLEVRYRFVSGKLAEENGTLPCEVLRARLKLPACPSRAQLDASTASVRFEGRGRGHGVGMDVERAKRSGLGQDAILEEAYR